MIGPAPAARTTSPTLGRARLLGLAALLLTVLGGAVARLGLHRGVTYSPADEQVYANYACHLSERGITGFGDLYATYLADPMAQLFPPPTRWGLLGPDAAASALSSCGPAALAWVSTLAGIALLALVAAFAWRRFPLPAALLATAFVASSPLHLHLGRRALGDEVVALVAFAAWWAMVAYAERRSGARWALVGVLLLLGCATKEVFVMFYPALVIPLALAWWRERQVRLADVALLIAPVLANAAVVAALTGDLDALVQVLRLVHDSSGSQYAEQYLSGAPHRVLIDLLLLAPVTVLAAIAAFGLLLDHGKGLPRLVAASLVASLVPFAFVGVQLVRLVAVSDVLIAILAAWGLVTLAGRWRGRIATLPSNAGPAAVIGVVALAGVGTNIAIMVAISRAGVYDPVTDSLLRALGMIP